MKNKALTIILSVILVISISLCIYQYTTTSKLKNSLSVLTNSKNEITTDIENKTAELNNITSEIEAANTTISELTARVDSLSSSINSTQLEIENVQQELSNNEYKGDNGTDALQGEYDSLSEEEQEMVDQIVEDMMKEHPEWFVETNPSTGNQDNYEHVGTPSTGELPGQLELDGDYSQYQGAQVY